MDLFSLKGKVAAVTGASRGLGKEMAIGLAEAGADIVGISYGSMEETKIEVEKLGRKFLEINADLSKVEKTDNILEEILKEYGKIDILVNNAGTIRREDAIEYTEEDWDYILNLNLKTVFFLSQKFAKQFIKQETGGKIINIASMLSFQGGIRVPAYTASKSGVMGITKALANEWAKYNINVNAIAPGYMETDNTKQIREDEKRNDEILSRIPAGRWGQPQDLVGSAIFLSSNASNYINGHTLAVDGGWLAR
ncbi:MAG: 2-dehydro-3-deoxy-D-gluconate 5-dehydrogenase KduD [Clostridiales bacterium]|nr:2-dehydro-3-deoxy-D-gluconate 5-dehydrogenase KduD [Clostridiales bacterium]